MNKPLVSFTVHPTQLSPSPTDERAPCVYVPVRSLAAHASDGRPPPSVAPAPSVAPLLSALYSTASLRPLILIPIHEPSHRLLARARCPGSGDSRGLASQSSRRRRRSQRRSTQWISPAGACVGRSHGSGVARLRRRGRGRAPKVLTGLRRGSRAELPWQGSSARGACRASAMELSERGGSRKRKERTNRYAHNEWQWVFFFQTSHSHSQQGK